MAVYVGLLRAINLGSYNKISMAALKALLADLGMKHPQTVVQSGNVVFETSSRSTAAIEKLLEASVAKTLGVETPCLVRTGEEWQQAIAANPFSKETKLNPARMVLMPLKDAPPPAAVKALRDAIKGSELVAVKGRNAYFLYPEGIGTSKLTITLIERKLGTAGTARNWNTVLKLGALTEKA